MAGQRCITGWAGAYSRFDSIGEGGYGQETPLRDVMGVTVGAARIIKQVTSGKAVLTQGPMVSSKASELWGSHLK